MALLLSLALACWVFPAFAQEAGEQSPAEQAAAAYQAQDWAKAAAGYEKVVAGNPADGRAWARLGISRYNLEHYSGAAEAFEHADQLGFAQQFVQFRLAATYARLGENDKAMEWLEKAVKSGFGNVEGLESEEALAPLRSGARFAELLQEVRVNQAPCENLEVYKQFDFWVGDWDVFTPDGQKAGENSIQRVSGGCILLENWTSANGNYTGKSINFYHPGKQKWVQLWVDGSGTVIPTEGVLNDGAMHLEGQLISRQGESTLYRGTWTPLPDGRVRQFLEESKDGGKTWNVWFDGFYVRKGTGASE